jgi:hypothetical protein
LLCGEEWRAAQDDDGGAMKGGGTPSRSELGSRLAGLLVRRSFPPLPLPNLTASITPSALS